MIFFKNVFYSLIQLNVKILDLLRKNERVNVYIIFQQIIITLCYIVLYIKIISGNTKYQQSIDKKQPILLSRSYQSKLFFFNGVVIN